MSRIVRAEALSATNRRSVCHAYRNGSDGQPPDFHRQHPDFHNLYRLGGEQDACDKYQCRVWRVYKAVEAVAISLSLGLSTTGTKSTFNTRSQRRLRETKQWRCAVYVAENADACPLQKIPMTLAFHTFARVQTGANAVEMKAGLGLNATLCYAWSEQYEMTA